MQMRFRLLGMAVILLGGVSTGFGQAQGGTVAQTPLQRLLDHFDLGLSAAGLLNGSVSGTTENTSVSPQPSLNQSGGSTVGLLATLRGQKSPYIGGEFNYTFEKYAYTFNFTPAFSPTNLTAPQDFKAQSTVNEFTLGYVAKPPHPIFGAQPFVGGGAGSLEFKPTKNGGDELPVQARAAYYYSLGVDSPILKDVGFRVGFRQVFYLAPDFGQNYLKTKKYTSTAEPTVGFYYHF